MKLLQGFQLLLLFSSCLLQSSSSSSKTSIVFTTLGRSRYTFDIFTLPIPPLPLSSFSIVETELQISDGESVNYNGFFPTEPSSLLSLLPLPPPDSPLPLEALVYVSERNGSSNIYVDFYPSPIANLTPSISHVRRRRRRVALQVPTRVQLPLLRTDQDDVDRVSMKDRPTISGEHLIYVSTHEESHVPRKSWAAVYSTHIPTAVTRRLTPPGIADFSPAVSPSGEWTAVASYGEDGWTGEIHDLKTGIYVFRTLDGSERAEVVAHGGWPCWADDFTLYFHRQSEEDGWWGIYKATIEFETLEVVSVERVTPPGFHAFTPAAGRGFIAMATRRSTSQFRHIELLDLDRNIFVEVTRTVSPNFHHFNPFFSPDYSRIGYHRCRGDGNSGSSSGPLMLENLRTPLPETSLFRIDGSFPSFSPDGRRIAYVGLPGVYIMNSDGSGKREVFSGNAFPTAWDWKRKGVIYTSHGPEFATGSSQVDVVSITLQEEEEEEGISLSPIVKKLTIGGENNAFPSPSPDGEWVVFRSFRSGHKNLYIMDAVEGESAGIRRLTNGPWTDTMCNWSPDGEWIAFSSDRDNPGSGSFSVYFIHPNGTGLKKVVQSGDGGRVNHPSFSPDSKSIVFTSDLAAVSAEPISNPHSYQPYGDIFTASIDGSDIRRLTHNSYEDGTPSWGPTFLKPADVVESMPSIARCKFDDCHWLGQQGRISPGPRCAK